METILSTDEKQWWRHIHNTIPS